MFVFFKKRDGRLANFLSCVFPSAIVKAYLTLRLRFAIAKKRRPHNSLAWRVGKKGVSGKRPETKKMAKQQRFFFSYVCPSYAVFRKCLHKTRYDSIVAGQYVCAVYGKWYLRALPEFNNWDIKLVNEWANGCLHTGV